MRKYETLVIARTDLGEDGLKSLLDEISAIIAREGGSVADIDIWGQRKLEYPIENEETGQYAVINYEAKAVSVRELERVLGIRDEILRSKTLIMEAG